jgi:hypothetical protein
MAHLSFIEEPAPTFVQETATPSVDSQVLDYS